MTSVLLGAVVLTLALGGVAAAGYAAPHLEVDAYSGAIQRDMFPVSGFQIAMAVIVVVILIAGGIALRRLSRPRKPPEPPDEPPESPKEV